MSRSTCRMLMKAIGKPCSTPCSNVKGPLPNLYKICLPRYNRLNSRDRRRRSKGTIGQVDIIICYPLLVISTWMFSLVTMEQSRPMDPKGLSSACILHAATCTNAYTATTKAPRTWDGVQSARERLWQASVPTERAQDSSVRSDGRSGRNLGCGVPSEPCPLPFLV